MRHLLLIISFCCIASIGFSQNNELDAIEKFFSEYQESEDFTSIFISKLMFGMMSNATSDDPEGQEVLDVIKDLTGLRILTSDNAPDGFYSKAHRLLQTKDYQSLMTIREEDSNVDFLVLEGDNDQIKELILLTGEDKSVVLMSFKGNLDLNKISRLSKTLDIDGAEHLKKLKDN